MKRVTLLAGREKSLRRRHPWVFAGAVAQVRGDPASGESVLVCDQDGKAWGVGAWSPASKIPVRLWSFDPEEGIDDAFFARRLRRAWEGRARLLSERGDDCCRLVHGEADGLPGLIVDRYRDLLVCQFLAAGVERWRETIVRSLLEIVPGVTGLWERSDAEVRQKEGLPLRSGLLAGPEPPALVEVRQGGALFLVDVRRGHKTGFYLDQAENRRRVAPWLAGARVLNVFSYTGAFAVAALQAGAALVTNVDSSQEALDLCLANGAANGLAADLLPSLRGDAFQLLRRLADEGAQFDAVILDPPKFVDNRARLEDGLRGYKDINLLGLRLLRPGGLLATFSCSGVVEREAFARAVAWAAMDLGREVQVLMELHQGPDHPVPLAFPEAAYLKGLFARVY